MDDVRTELIQVISDEFNEAGITNTVVEPAAVDRGGHSPAQMVVPLGTDLSGRTPVAHVYFMPVLENPPVVQYMVFFDYDIDDDAVSDLGRFVALLNSNLTITGFEFNESLGLVVFRHTHAVGTTPLDPAVIAWPLYMLRYAVDNYGPLVEFVARGGQYDRAVDLLTRSLEQLAEAGQCS